MAVQRAAPAAKVSPSACATSSVWPTAPLALVLRFVDEEQTAFVLHEWMVWNGAPSMRSSATTCPPASTTQQEMAILAPLACSIATAIIFRAPSWVKRLVVVTYICTYSAASFCAASILVF